MEEKLSGRSLQPADIMALIGPNNAGKTNILCALNFVLGDRWPSANSIEQTDRFNKDPGRPIRICISFARGHGNEAGIAAISVAESQGRLFAHYRHFDSDRTHFLNDATRGQFPVVYLDAARNFDNQFSMSRWSLFGRIARQLHDDFERTATPDIKQQLTTHLSSAQDILKTPLYRSFEAAITEAFQSQIRHAMHNVRLDFRTFDPLNFYKAIYPTLIDGELEKSPTEAGSGVRNLIVLALFRAYATAFRNSTVFAIEEPEIYLHPHAQRSLSRLYREMAAAGHQVFYSSHSAAFVDVSRSDQIVLVERKADDEEEIATQTCHIRENELLDQRRRLHPTVQMTLEGVRERYRNIAGMKHAEGFFARTILLAEGSSEEEVFTVFAMHMGVDFDGLGVSVVSSDGKNNLDSFWQLYRCHKIPVYLVFDNDRQKTPRDRAQNAVLTRMLEVAETDLPDAVVEPTYAVIEGDIENLLQAECEVFEAGLYHTLCAEARQLVGSGKPLVARYVARQLVARNFVPPTIATIIRRVSAMATG